MRLSLGVKTIGFFLLVVLINAIGSGITVYKVSQADQIIQMIQEHNLPRLMQTNAVAFNTANQVSDIRGYLLTGNKSMLDEARQFGQTNEKLTGELLASATTGEGRKLVGELQLLAGVYQDIAENKIIPLKAAGRHEEAVNLAVRELTPAARALTGKANEYAAFRENQIKTVFSQTIADMHATKSISITISLLSIVVSVLIGFFSARSITRPVGLLVATAGEIAGGKLNHDIEVKYKDEIGDLQQAFKTMVLNLRDVVQTVQSNAEQVAASSEELTASAEQAAKAANQVTDSVMNVAQGAERQVEAVNETMAVVEQISAGIQQVAANADMVAATSARTAQAAAGGSQEVDRAINQMTTIENAVRHSADVVAGLGDRSQEIGQIIAMISGIAGQTNLLALNAAIEAARAGEQGRGFAVVADEVRKLAEQSQEATKQITDLIGLIQADTNQAVMAMEAGTRETKAGTAVINSTRDVFNSIVSLIEQQSSQIREISAAIQQMAGGSQHIVTAVRKIDNVSKMASQHTQSVSAATQEQSAASQEIAASSEALVKMAEELQNAVRRFTI
ncbi:HAMP domain-containing methyl-accepting chemotaxis protein [Sporomusa sp.]|uniref:methyl-accepting chemotaxis protein n=1 Tax=Sporomusa sp. TaxID=2078658 RepID=UPI002BA17057|nr:HAMP domain-containing methyl-accepting chemotaxis protein [Sporomusa sp.]HWR09454.1 HAMP domain-containing methyl-accepting chemotaxis protein [Sporomusa sp.]